MLIKLRPFFYSVIFYSGLQVTARSHGQFFYVMAFFLLLLSFIGGWKLGKSWKFAVLPFFFTLSSVAQLYLIGPEFERQIFIVLSVAVYYLAMFGASRLGVYPKDQTARGMNMAATSATIFLSYSSVYGLYLNFLVPTYALMLSYLLITFLVSYQYFSLLDGEGGGLDLVYSLLLALVMTEIIWTMNYWPFGYLTTAVIALILYYVLWDVIQCHFQKILTKKRVVANMVFFSTLIAFILVTSKWIPVI